MMLRFSLLLALSWTLTGSEGKARFDQEKEVYRIYSLLMTNPGSARAGDNSRYLISDTTSVWDEMPCVRPPRANKAEFAEVLADFKRRRETPRVLKRYLLLSKPYELLTEAQVEAFEEERPWPTTLVCKPNPLFTGATDVFTFSDVYFSKNGQLALTAISSWCGGRCGLHEWKVLKKLPTGEWQEQPWVYCPPSQNERVVVHIRCDLRPTLPEPILVWDPPPLLAPDRQ
jgi:hypothetical protein